MSTLDARYQRAIDGSKSAIHKALELDEAGMRILSQSSNIFRVAMCKMVTNGTRKKARGTSKLQGGFRVHSRGIGRHWLQHPSLTEKSRSHDASTNASENAQRL
jgi:hypothetical protein